MSDFDEFLNLQARRKEHQSSWLRRKPEWIKQIDSLYQTVRRHLSRYRQISFSEETVNITEELTGAYEVSCLVVHLGSDTVRFKPVGTYLFGSPGRVDLVGAFGTVRFVLVVPGTTRPSITFGTVPQNKLADRLPAASISSYVWKISTNPPHITYQDIDERSLQVAIMGVTNG